MMVLNQDSRSESSQLKIFIGSYSDLGEKIYPYGDRTGVMYASWKSLLKEAVKAEQ